MLDLKALLDDTEQHVKTELKSNPTVVDVGDDLDLEDVAVGARRWVRVNDVVAVVADLKNSTKLGMNKHRASSAAIYEAAVERHGGARTPINAYLCEETDRRSVLLIDCLIELNHERVPVVEQTSRGGRSLDICSRLVSERAMFLGTGGAGRSRPAIARRHSSCWFRSSTCRVTGTRR